MRVPKENVGSTGTKEILKGEESTSVGKKNS